MLMACACASPLWAQPASSPPAPAADAPAPAPAPPAPEKAEKPTKPEKPKPANEEEDDATSVSGVVINGKRMQVGAVVGDIKPEIQLSPADIQSYGVSTINELLSELAPETRSDRGRGASQPVILLNGRRISSFNEIQNIPTEALLRVDILPEEVALKYGYTADQKVINFVLRRRFRAVTDETKGGGSTEGGYVTGQEEGDLLRLHNDDRINLDLKYQGNSNITEADRNVPDNVGGSPYDLAGNITSTTPGAAIDPRLLAAGGVPATVAGVPASAATTAPTLAQFGPTAGVPNTTNIGPDRTLSPSSQQLTLNGVLAHGVLGGVSLTVNGTLGLTQTQSLLGLPGVALTLPQGSPFSPFAGPVSLYRYYDGLGPLNQTATGWTGHLGVTANKDWKGWRYSLTAAYDHADSLTITQEGVSAAPAQALLNALSPTFNPYGPLTSAELITLADAKARGLTDSANAQFLANGPILKLPAGDLYASFKFGDTISLINALSERNAVVTTSNLTRNDFNTQLNLDIPLIKAAMKGWGVIGDLTLSGNAAVDQLSDFGTLPTFGYGLNWTPIHGYTLIVSTTQDHQAPSLQQLDNPEIQTPGQRVLDYTTGQTVQVTTISGGNAALLDDYRRVIKIGLTAKPFSTQELTLTATYLDTHFKNAIGSVPAATALVEAAFPQAFIRNAQGELVEVDQRAVNFASEDKTELRYGFNFAMPVGPAPPAPPPRPAGDVSPYPRGPGGGGGGRGGGGGGRGGGGFGGFNRGQQQGRFQIALYHTVYFEDTIHARPGFPAFDLLNGAASGSNGGQVRHELEGQLGYTRSGLGLRFSADWKSATKVDGGTPAGDLDFSEIATLNMRLWDNFGAQPAVVRRWRWLRGARATLEVNNLFNEIQTVHNALGQAPLSYLPAYVNPTGRTVELSLRKLFF
jgi:hypothetical protein